MSRADWNIHSILGVIEIARIHDFRERREVITRNACRIGIGPRRDGNAQIIFLPAVDGAAHRRRGLGKDCIRRWRQFLSRSDYGERTGARSARCNFQKWLSPSKGSGPKSILVVNRPLLTRTAEFVTGPAITLPVATLVKSRKRKSCGLLGGASDTNNRP